MDSVILPFSPDPYNSSFAVGESNFHLEDLLDFPNDDEEEVDGAVVAAGTTNEKDREPQQERDEDEEEVSSQATEDSTLTQAQPVSSLGFSVKSQEALDKEALDNKACSQEACSSGLCVPPDELAYQLEWLSAFNEDSSYSGDTNLASLVSSGSLRVPRDETNSRRQGANGGGSVTDSSHGEGNNKFQSSSPVSVLEERSILYANSYCTHVPSRARSKRSRNGGRVWSFDSLMPVLLDNNRQTCFMEESELSPPSSHHRAAQEKKGCALPQHHQAKRAKHERLNHKNATEVLAPRRCSHCLVPKTPQWRAGPMGPKTLCNACGVRFKSGRLLPEYRPAGSPTFVSEIHSNSHKRVLEMRRLKEMEGESETSKGDDNSYIEMDHHNAAATAEASGGREDNHGLEGPYEDKPCSGNPPVVPPMEPNELPEQRVNAPFKEISRYSIGSHKIKEEEEDKKPIRACGGGELSQAGAQLGCPKRA